MLCRHMFLFDKYGQQGNHRSYTIDTARYMAYCIFDYT